MGAAAKKEDQSGICVYTPLRIRLGPDALARYSGELEKALYAAMGRALAHSREVVLKPRGDSHVVLNAPTFRWSDNALHELPVDQRRHLQSRIEKICGELCISEGIFGWGRNRRPAQNLELIGTVREPLDHTRLDEEADFYLTPSYDKGGEKKKVPVVKADAADEPIVVLGSFADFDDLYKALQSFFKKDFLPRGKILTGVYGFWQADGLPRLFWVTGLVEEGSSKGNPIFASIQLSGGRIENGRFVATPQEPMNVKPGERYTLTGLTTPKKSKDVEYWAERHDSSGGKPVPVYIHDSRIVGKTIRFGVVKEIIDPASVVTIVVTPSVPPPPGQPVFPLPPRRKTAGYDAWYPLLNPVPEGGEPEWLWWWFVWFNVRPAEVRALPPLRKVFADLQNAGARDKAIELNWLWELQQWQVFIYRAYCRNLTLELLETSRKNMAEFRTAIRGGDFKARLAAELAILKQPAEELVEVDELPVLESELETALYGDYTEGPGNRRITVQKPNPRLAKELIPRVEHARAEVKNAEDYRTILQLFEQMDPILALFTVSGEHTISIEAGIAQAIRKTPDDLIAWMDASLDYLTKKSWEATNEISNDHKAAAKLKVVQQIANEQLEPWFKEVPLMRAAMEYVTTTSIVDWLLLGFALLVLTIFFPPVGIALSAGVAVGSAIHSTLQARQLSRLGQARLAQLGFTPLVSEAEIQAAWFEAAVDIFFAVLEIKGVGKGIAKFIEGSAERAAAREAVGVVGQRIEQLLSAWRKFDQWPIALQARIRANVTEQLVKSGVTGAAEAEAAFAAVQREMLYRYEQDLLQFQRRFGEAVAGGAVSVRDVEALRKWLQTEFKRPDKFLEELAGELQPGKSLFEETIGRQLRNLPPVNRVVVDFFEQLSEQEIAQFKSGLRNGGLLTPNRVSALAKQAGLSTTYRDLAGRLDGILGRVENPERAFALMEDLLAGRKDAAAILNGLEASANPRRAVEAMLSPKVLEARLEGGIEELFEAFAEPAKTGGRVGRIVADVDEKGAVKLFREVEEAGGARVTERWEGKAQGWVGDAKARIAAPKPARAVAEVSAEAEAKAAENLENLAKAKRPSGGLTSAAARAGKVLPIVKGHAVYNEIAKAVAREGEETGRRLVDGLGYLLEDGVKGKELDGLADFLRRGGTGAEAADILETGATAARAGRRGDVRAFFEKVLTFREADFAGVTLVLGSRATRFEGAEAVRYIARNFDRPEAVFGALADLAPHADGLEKVVGYLQSFSQSNNRAAVAQLKAAQELLAEFPGSRIVFEDPVRNAAGELIREIDVRIVTAYSRVTVLDVELKEISSTFFVSGSRARKQFARDVVRSVLSGKPGERALGRMRWLIRGEEIVSDYVKKSGVKDLVQARKDVLRQLKDLFEPAFNHAEIAQLTEAQLAAARKDFEENFAEILKLF